MKISEFHRIMHRKCDTSPSSDSPGDFSLCYRRLLSVLFALNECSAIVDLHAWLCDKAGGGLLH